MSIDYRESPQPALTTIVLGDGHVEISASPPTASDGASQDWMPSTTSTTSSGASLPSSTPSPAPSPPFRRPKNYSLPQSTSTPTPRISTITIFTAAETSSTSSNPVVVSSSNSANSESLSGFNLVAVIVLPILTLMIVSSTALLFCRARHHRKPRRKASSQAQPPKPSILAALKSPFREQHKTPSAQHSAYFPAVTVSRDASPTPETRGRPNAQTRSPPPRDGAVVADPPPPYVLQADSLRPPSMYGRIHTRSPSPTLSEANLAVHDDATLRSPFGSPYLDVDGDALSDISIERGYSPRRQRDADEISFVSALEPDEQVERDLHYVV